MNEQSKVKKVRTAVIGHGHLGKWHCDKTAQMENAELTYVIDSHPDNLALARQKFPHAKTTDSLHSILPEIDAAIIVTPTSTHFSLAKTLMEAGKHIFCEKPLCATLAEAQSLEKIFQVAENKNLIVQVGHSERFHEAWEYLKDPQNNYTLFLQTPGVVKIDRLAPFKGRATDVDVVVDLMIHDLDLLIYLFGEIPESVHAHGYKVLTSKWDYVCATLNFPSGRQAILTCHRNDTREVRQLTINNQLGSLQMDLMTQEMLFARPGSPEQVPADARIVSKSFTRRDHLFLEQKEFFNSIVHQQKPVVSFQDGLIAVMLMSSVLQSVESGKTIAIDC